MTEQQKAIEKMNLYCKICQRAEKLGICNTSRFTAMMDIELADKHWQLRLEDWLNADNLNFAHDFVGIQGHINRITKEFAKTFVPRFATI